jgi:hypothetical protein
MSFFDISGKIIPISKHSISALTINSYFKLIQVLQ